MLPGLETSCSFKRRGSTQRASLKWASDRLSARFTEEEESVLEAGAERYRNLENQARSRRSASSAAMAGLNA